MALEGFRVERRGEDGDKVVVVAGSGPIRVITTIPRGVVDDLSPSKLATAKEREDFIERNLDRISRVIETKVAIGQFRLGGHDGHERFIDLETAYLRGLDLK